MSIERPSRVAMVSMHTSPLEMPGSGDAGGLNVHLVESARRIAAAGTAVDIFTRAGGEPIDHVAGLGDGIRVIPVGPESMSLLTKEQLPAKVNDFASGMLAHAARDPLGSYDLVHSHYWISGLAAQQAATEWSVPLVHTMHTLGQVKNRQLASGDLPEPQLRLNSERELVLAADMLLANTEHERRDLIELYGAEPNHIRVVPPGVNLKLFHPGDKTTARHLMGLSPHRRIILFVGRLQPLKAPDVLIRALDLMLKKQPELRDELQLILCGGASGTAADYPSQLKSLATQLGVHDVVDLRGPVAAHQLAELYRAADIVTVPSYSESFGLVALEAQASGTPVVGAAIGGLTTSISDGRSGVLVPSHDPRDWADTLTTLLSQPRLLTEFSESGPRHAAAFDWQFTAAATMSAYRGARHGVAELQAAH